MKLTWSNDKIGPSVWLAKGFAGTFVAMDGGLTATLYLMPPGQSICPINRERALRYRAFNIRPDAIGSAKVVAQYWESLAVQVAAQRLKGADR